MLEQSINVKLTTLNLPENVFIYCLYLSTTKTRAAGARDVRRTQGTKRVTKVLSSHAGNVIHRSYFPSDALEIHSEGCLRTFRGEEIYILRFVLVHIEDWALFVV